MEKGPVEQHPQSYPCIRAAAVDGRCHNIYYRQTQLERLHQKLRQSISAIEKAIVKDCNHSRGEIAAQIYQALDAVKQDYASLQPTKAIEQEHRITHGLNARTATRPAGIVYIEPCTHTMFYAVIAPLSAAIAAGNCVIVLLESNVCNLSDLLRNMLMGTLDQNTFAIASSPITDSKLLASMIMVDQTGYNRTPRSSQILSYSKSSVVAVVDRTADIPLAARELITARLSFGGCSPYAPDLVLVNEFVKNDFLNAVAAEISQRSSTDASADMTLENSDHAVNEITARHDVAKALDRSSASLRVYATRSLDDAIDLVSSISKEPCLASYHFCNAASGKYLTQFIDAHVSFINHIPKQMLLGPAYPIGHPVDISIRYPQSLFLVPRPAYIQIPPDEADINAALAPRGNSAAVHVLIAQAEIPLARMKRSEGGSVGFFEQGFLMNAMFMLICAISVTTAGIIWVTRYGKWEFS